MTDEVGEDTGPTVERLRHGPVEHAVETITYDREERPQRGLADRAVGLVERMCRRGTISEEMMDAAERFRADFRLAALEPLRAAQLRERTQNGGLLPQEISWRAESARRRISKAMRAVGEPGGSCLWHVIGCEHTLKQWATFKMQPEVATGVLVATLGVLEAYYSGKR